MRRRLYSHRDKSVNAMLPTADVLRNITNAEEPKYQLVADHLGVAKSNVEQ